jgi:hypothetical protein
VVVETVYSVNRSIKKSSTPGVKDFYFFRSSEIAWRCGLMISLASGINLFQLRSSLLRTKSVPD